MHLDPRESDAWTETVEGWSLDAEIGKVYAVSGLKT